MSNMTEQQIEENLKRIASFEPPQSSVRWMSQNVRNLIENKKEKKPDRHSILYYVLSSAAMLLMGIGYLYYSSILISGKPPVHTQSKPSLNLAELRAVFQSGGQKALEEHLEKVESTRQPQAEAVTLEDVMKELNKKEN